MTGGTEENRKGTGGRRKKGESRSALEIYTRESWYKGGDGMDSKGKFWTKEVETKKETTKRKR